jgi:hypothetical protein
MANKGRLWQAGPHLPRHPKNHTSHARATARPTTEDEEEDGVAIIMPAFLSIFTFEHCNGSQWRRAKCRERTSRLPKAPCAIPIETALHRLKDAKKTTPRATFNEFDSKSARRRSRPRFRGYPLATYTVRVASARKPTPRARCRHRPLDSENLRLALYSAGWTM